MRSTRLLIASGVIAAAVASPAASGADDLSLFGSAPRLMPQSELTGSFGGIIGDARFFGTYNGLSDGDTVPNLEPKLILRDEQSGTWFRVTGRNLGLDNRELRLEHDRQGDWRYFIDLSQTPRTDPLEITTGLTGIGGPRQTVAGEPRRRVDFETGRDQVRIGLGKILGDRFDVNLSYRHEEKRGARPWSAWGGGLNFNFLAEPIDFVSREVSGTASYTGRRLQLTGGYLGSFFSNDNKVLNNNSGQPRIALPADNQSHKVFLDAGYSLTPKTRATLKASYGVTLQDEDFFTTPTIAGNSQRKLDGRVDNLLVHLGLTTRPTSRLSVNARLRYEDRDDRTNTAQYIGATATRSGLNIPFSRTTATADLEGNYRLPERFRLIVGVTQEHWSRSKPRLRQASFRDNTDETSVRLKLKRSLMETLGGSIAFVHADRSGSGWNDGTDSRIDAINLADRDRYKWEGSLDWAPSDRFTAQLRLAQSWDTYDSKPLGPRDGQTQELSVDLSYDLSRAWNVSAWVSVSDLRLDQATNGDGTDSNGVVLNDVDWAADLRHLSRAAGLALRGTLMEGLTAGADLEISADRSEQELVGLSGAPLPSLPHIRYRQASLGLFLDYALSPMGRMRLRYGYSRISADDYTWRGWTYADGTTVSIPAREDTHFIGLAYALKL